MAVNRGLGLCVILALVLPCTTALKFRPNGSFRIVQFTDLHYGDQITGNNVVNNATAYWDELLQPTYLRNLSFATLFGNHDDNPFESSLSQHGPANVPGVSNYVLEIEGSHGTVTPLFMFDTGGGTLPEVITQAHVDWFRNESARVAARNGNKTLPGMAFLHIPMPEFASVQPSSAAALRARRGSATAPCFGMAQDGISPYTDNSTGLLDAMASAGSVHAAITGHNHGNDWLCRHSNGMWLGFGRHSGYGGYGTWARGARVYELQAGKPGATYTYVRMEDGSIEDAGVLEPTASVLQ
ncbi:uncharacterized protein MONBRDRAFT_6216 [Monosiga brevicollis MX1]|uniref:Calcineurin-like phosphoesterase domain-containing protein n=1 Tax=Monosiga brevicollis TaxID=81824 RepID=A9UT65_MONBE|nr:uncharacterized protein MONBRDRAFT_6216 [Monosiga brevicollis MX1]EDQ91438.1 predicted protein [Monosiga brevicollis MX1]|eukprot:XP_001743860.1 hypothetical protein [Monosiga brevicollis MX1]